MNILRAGLRAPAILLIVLCLIAGARSPFPWQAVPAAWALPEYSERSGQGCKTCHASLDGGTLTETGLEYAASGYKWPPEGGFRVLGPIRKPVRLFIGLLHIVAAFMWFGTILYVHILLRPAYAAKGLPHGEMVLGLVSMALVGVTGVLLTVSRIRSLDVLWESRWGALLSIKIVIYFIMVSSALFIVSFVGPKLRRAAVRPGKEVPSVFDPLTLSGYDGKEGRPAYVAFQGKAYDVTGLKLWKGGMHIKHRAGEDLTDALGKAPHGEEKLDGLPVLGAYDSAMKPALRPEQKAFYFIAYMNLALVFLALIVISLWRWGI